MPHLLNLHHLFRASTAFRCTLPAISVAHSSTRSLCSSGEGKKTKVAVFDCKYLKKQLDEKLADTRPDIEFTYYDSLLTRETATLAAGHDAVSLFVNGQIEAPTADALKRHGVGMIALRCAGFNHVDVNACKELGLSVATVPAYSPYAVAEFTVALLMCLNRKVVTAYNRIRNGNFALEGLGGFDVHGKTIGVLGTGKIGFAFCSIMLGFGCKILAVDPYPNPHLVDNPNVQYVSNNEMFELSDVIALFAPATKENHHIVNRYSIGRMKPGVMILNTARGSLVKTADLVDAIVDKRVGAAGLDVLEEEGDLFYTDHSEHILKNPYVSRILTLPNVILTSHMSFLTQEALSNIAETTMFNIGEFADGKRMHELTNSVLPKD
ncbi:hypothetical protein SARC_01317 [Sphaeroforma arctica JP610]|uniref:D-lactate dehydrogenase n=1 Tax=Sphaeroforma arctica JP610 TaxID=667725 RepID=A0A0L0GCA9_9EUKA|nr:hypothetical protein SARC_01317 [Sphaeroforma arctica JP610]KNC86544.1 hypothetical protein SARC_01317 [Sphaeroforma arctica JP610]|eukprot:XP_014160446.1 hypothetical protein SARC_01317 [Sphaeroforma arctica JP610]